MDMNVRGTGDRRFSSLRGMSTSFFFLCVYVEEEGTTVDLCQSFSSLSLRLQLEEAKKEH